MDIIVLGSGVMDIEVEEFKALPAPHGVHVYPCLYGWPSGYSPIPAELAAGLALNYWSQGADGIYLFNWFPHTKNNSENNLQPTFGERNSAFPASKGLQPTPSVNEIPPS